MTDVHTTDIMNARQTMGTIDSVYIWMKSECSWKDTITFSHPSDSGEQKGFDSAEYRMVMNRNNKQSS